MVRNSGLLVAFLLAAACVSASEGLGDWMGHLFINGNMTPANADGVQICVYLGDSGTALDNTTVGEDTSGYYLLHAYGASGQNVSFRVFCEYPVNENPQNWSGSPPTNLLNLTINHTTAPVVTVISPLGTPAPGTLTMAVATDESALCRYAATAALYEDMGHETAWGASHSWSISAPSYGVTYTYYIRCVDHFGYVSAPKTLSFTTSSTYIPPGPGGGSSGGSTGPGPEATPTPVKQCSALGGACAVTSDCCNASARCLNYVCTAAALPTPTPAASAVANVSVPGTSTVGSNVTITVTDSAGNPLAGVTVRITSPSGEELELITDENGTVRFRAGEVGVYAYDVLGYNEASTKSTNVQASAATPTPTPRPATPRPTVTPVITPTPTPGTGPDYTVALLVVVLVVLAGAALVGALAISRWLMTRKR